MMPASSNSLTVRYTVEIEILSSTATQRRYNSSTSGWSTASASTRAMTRRCSVIRMPVAAQRASMPEAVGAVWDFNAVMIAALERTGLFATLGILRQVSPHQKRVPLFPVGLLVVAFAPSDDGKSGPFVKPSRRRVIFLDLQKDAARAAAGEMAEMRQQEVARQAAAAMAGIDRNRQYFGLVRRDARHGEADELAPEPQAM